MRISDWSSDVCSSDLDDDKRHFSAIVELRQIAGKTDPLKMPAEYQWRLADNYLGFGMRDRAEEIYRNLAATAPDAERARKGVGTGKRGTIRLELGGRRIIKKKSKSK